MDKSIKQDKVLSIGDYKEKVEKKEKKIKEFKEGPESLPDCTCGLNIDYDDYLSERLATEHFLKDRMLYLEELQTSDPLEIYMGAFDKLMCNVPLVILDMHTQLASMEFIHNHFKEGMIFYREYIKDNKNLSSEARIKANELREGYEKYKIHIVQTLVDSYISDKLTFLAKNFNFAWTEAEIQTRKNILDTSLTESQGYIRYIKEQFRDYDLRLTSYILTTASENLDSQIEQKLNGDHISKSEVKTLEVQMNESLNIIKETMAYNRKRDLRMIIEEYEELKDSSSLEDRALMLIDIELRKREIDGVEYTDKSCSTVNNNTSQLIKTLGMEILIEELSTKELENLLQQFKSSF